MPDDGIEWIPRDEVLRFDEIVHLVSIFHSFGVNKFRLTGGEPTIRSDFPRLVSMIQGICPTIKLSMTTNGLLLSQQVEQYYNTGIRRINISLDTLDSHKYKDISRRDAFEKVISGINAAMKYPFDEVKINAVALRAFNMDELEEFIDFSDRTGIEVRFIEFMPFNGNRWELSNYISKKEMLEIISKNHTFELVKNKDPARTSTTYKIIGTNAKIGFIASVSESFCNLCNRLRIISIGNVRTCLHSPHEIKLHELIRSDVNDSSLRQKIREGVLEKWEGHPEFRVGEYRPPVDDKSMILIGG